METSLVLTPPLSDLTLRNPGRRIGQLSAPWGARIPCGGRPGIYLLASGSAVLLSRGRAPIALETGDVLVLPQGAAHAIASCPNATLGHVEEFHTASIDTSAQSLEGGGGGATTLLHALCFDVADSSSRAILEFAPRVAVVRASTARPWFAHIARAIVEIGDAGVRAPARSQERLGELMLAEALAGTLLNAERVFDAAVMQAVLLLRAGLGRKWTMRALALHVGVSRSALYDRFVRSVGYPPSAYLLRARMEEAALLLRNGESPQTVAARVGYTWSSSFTVAFTRFHGVPPSVYRRAARAEHHTSLSSGAEVFDESRRQRR